MLSTTATCAKTRLLRSTVPTLAIILILFDLFAMPPTDFCVPWLMAASKTHTTSQIMVMKNHVFGCIIAQFK
jgi:hypothetical protein